MLFCPNSGKLVVPTYSCLFNNRMQDDQRATQPGKTAAKQPDSRDQPDLPEERHPGELPEELIDHLCRSSRITAREATHLVIEVLSFYSETADEFLRARHQELQALGYNNRQIFSTLQEELSQRRFKAKPLSARQIRRAIYG